MLGRGRSQLLLGYFYRFCPLAHTCHQAGTQRTSPSKCSLL